MRGVLVRDGMEGGPGAGGTARGFNEVLLVPFAVVEREREGGFGGEFGMDLMLVVPVFEAVIGGDFEPLKSPGLASKYL